MVDELIQAGRDGRAFIVVADGEGGVILAYATEPGETLEQVGEFFTRLDRRLGAVQ